MPLARSTGIFPSGFICLSCRIHLSKFVLLQVKVPAVRGREVPHGEVRLRGHPDEVRDAITSCTRRAHPVRDGACARVLGGRCQSAGRFRSGPAGRNGSKPGRSGAGRVCSGRPLRCRASRCAGSAAGRRYDVGPAERWPGNTGRRHADRRGGSNAGRCLAGNGCECRTGAPSGRRASHATSPIRELCAIGRPKSRPRRHPNLGHPGCWRGG